MEETFLREHAGRWLPGFFRAVEKSAEDPFHEALGRVGAALRPSVWVAGATAGIVAIAAWAVVGTLLAGVVIGQLNIKVPSTVKSIFFLLFLFATGYVVGLPSLRLRGDYLAIVTLGFGEIVRIFMNNLSQPVNITNGPQGITLIDPISFGATVGAAMEAAAIGVPALAASLETPHDKHLSYDLDVDFSTAAHFTALFAKSLMEKSFPPDVNLLKLDVPSNATLQTPWVMTRLSRQRYFIPTKPQRTSWDEPAKVGYTEAGTIVNEPTDSDVYVLRVARKVSLTPLSLDFTSRVDFKDVERILRA